MPQPTVLVIIADGFEEIEAITPVDVLRRAGVDVQIACIGDGIHVRGRSGIMMHADGPLASLETKAFDCILLPGGPGVRLLRADYRVLGMIKRQQVRGGWIAGICAAPLVLKDAGVLDGKRFTAHFSTIAELPTALSADRVVIDENLITSQGAGTALEFGLAIAVKLTSEKQTGEIAKSICA